MSEVDISADALASASRNSAVAIDINALTTLHGQFLAQLNELERIGEHVAAAYLVAATDVLERRLAQAGLTVSDRQDGIVADFAQRLASRLGSRALDVARTQLTCAEGSTLAVWSTIVTQLERGTH